VTPSSTGGGDVVHGSLHIVGSNGKQVVNAPSHGRNIDRVGARSQAKNGGFTVSELPAGSRRTAFALARHHGARRTEPLLASVSLPKFMFPKRRPKVSCASARRG
jgi:hypothetical protein